jgi:3-dehydroquinate dehydratase II
VQADPGSSTIGVNGVDGPRATLSRLRKNCYIPSTMGKPVYVLNGPNLNLLGIREPAVYGRDTLDDVRRRTETRASQHGLAVDFRQSNLEGELVTWVQEARTGACGIIINAGGYTHTSIALLDALQAVELPAIEVHLSNIFKRDAFRHHSYISLGCTGVICGLGARGYELAIEAMAHLIKPAST